MFKAAAVLLLIASSSIWASESVLSAHAGSSDGQSGSARPPDPLFHQGWENGAKEGNQHAGKTGWFLLGFGNVPLLWLPWLFEPQQPMQPSVQTEAEFNNGFQSGYRAGWKNAHKTYYIAGMVVSSAAIAAAILATHD